MERHLTDRELLVLRNRPWPSRSRILDVALADTWYAVGDYRNVLAGGCYVPHPDITVQELAFAEDLARLLSLDEMIDLYRDEYDQAAKVGERERQPWEGD